MNDSEHPLHIHGGNGRPWVIAYFDDFDGPHSFEALSNFYVGDPIYLRLLSGKPFMTGEHAFAAMKTRTHADFVKIRQAPSPGAAKALGRRVALRPDWEEVKYDVMMAVLRAKFTPHREEGDILLATGDALLIEGTHWGDRVWGVSMDAREIPLLAPGRNWLGTMLMARRAELKAEVRFGHAHITGQFNAWFATQDR